MKTLKARAGLTLILDSNPNRRTEFSESESPILTVAAKKKVPTGMRKRTRCLRTYAGEAPSRRGQPFFAAFRSLLLTASSAQSPSLPPPPRLASAIDSFVTLCSDVIRPISNSPGSMPTSKKSFRRRARMRTSSLTPMRSIDVAAPSPGVARDH